MKECIYCGEEVLEDEQHPHYALQSIHKECGIRQAIGSVAHISHRCACDVPGSSEGDPPGLTKREAAKAAVSLYIEVNKL